MSRPYGPLGLLVSLIVIVALASLYCLALLALAAAIELLVEGAAQTSAVFLNMSHAMKAGGTSFQTILLGAGIFIYAATVAAIVTVARWRAGSDWRDLVAWLPWSPKRAGCGFWLLVAGGLIYGLAASAAVSWLRPSLDAAFSFPQNPLGLAVSFILIVLFAPVAEEALFRGWIYTSLRARFSFLFTNVVSAGAFAIAHWDKTHLYALAIFPLGLMLGAAREKSGSIRASATFHGLYNCFAFLLTVYGAHGNPAGTSS